MAPTHKGKTAWVSTFPLIKWVAEPKIVYIDIVATDVAVATFTGKLKKYTSVGVLKGPPPIPKKLDMKPNKVFTAVAIGSMKLYL